MPIRQFQRDDDAYRALFGPEDLAVFVMAQGIEDCNDAACRLLGHARERLLGRSPLSFSAPVQPDGTPSAEGGRRRAEERQMLHEQPLIRRTLALAAEADVTFVGIGDLGPKAPLHEDGFITEAELKALHRAGAVGEIVGWAFDRDGRLVEGITNDRVASAPIPSREKSLVIALAMGERKLPGILAAVTRRLVNGLITDERTAAALLAGA